MITGIMWFQNWPSFGEFESSLKHWGGGTHGASELDPIVSHYLILKTEVFAIEEAKQMRLLSTALIHSVKFMNFTHLALQLLESLRHGIAQIVENYLSLSLRKQRLTKMMI